jgi:fibronectin type 3 domain-containing protein
VKRALVSGGPYIGVACSTSTTYTDTGLSNGTTYYYVVSADYTAGPDSGGESPDSTQASATPTGSLPPAAPVLTASTGNPKASVSLNWTQTAGVTQDNIYRRIATGSYSSTPTAQVSATTKYLDNKLSSGTTYCYVVIAVNSGGESPRSNESCAKAK